MRKHPFVTVGTAPDSKAAEILAAVLRRAGLHPADVQLVAPFPAQGVKMPVPIEVPAEEAEAARQALNAHSESEANY
jgi:hypothetical protein